MEMVIKITPNEFQELTAETEIYTNAAQKFVHEIFTAKDASSFVIKDAIEFTSIMYCTGKLNGEAGEIAEEVFKAFRDNGKIDNDRAERIFKECGDSLWYIARILDLLGYTLEECMEVNVEKLLDRKERGTLTGSGSDR